MVAHRVTLSDGSSGEVQGLDLSQAEVPDKSYFGETCGVEYKDGAVRIMFAQPKLGGTELRSLVLISMPLQSARFFAKSFEKMQKPTLDEILTVARIEERPLSEFPATEPEQTALLTANVAALAVRGEETCLDFYHANAFAYLMNQRGNHNELTLEPVVRVNMGTGLLAGLKRRLKEVIAKLPVLDKAEEELIDAD